MFNGMRKKFWKERVVTVSAPSATALYILKWLKWEILFCVYFTAVKKKKERKKKESWSTSINIRQIELRSIWRTERAHFIMTKGSSHQEELTILNV